MRVPAIGGNFDVLCLPGAIAKEERFGLWLAQFLVPHWREEISFLYGIWLVIELSSAAWRPGRLRAFAVFPALWSRRAGKRR